MSLRVPHLLELDISDCNNITSAGTRTFIANLTRLHTLSAARTYAIEPIEFT